VREKTNPIHSIMHPSTLKRHTHKDVMCILPCMFSLDTSFPFASPASFFKLTRIQQRPTHYVVVAVGPFLFRAFRSAKKKLKSSKIERRKKNQHRLRTKRKETTIRQIHSRWWKEFEKKEETTTKLLGIINNQLASLNVSKRKKQDKTRLGLRATIQFLFPFSHSRNKKNLISRNEPKVFFPPFEWMVMLNYFPTSSIFHHIIPRIQGQFPSLPRSQGKFAI